MRMLLQLVATTCLEMATASSMQLEASKINQLTSMGREKF